MKKLLLSAVILLFWVAVWQGVSSIVGQELLVPAPITVFRVLWQAMATASFWKAVGASLLRILCGYVAAVIFGCLLAVLTVRFSLLHHLFSPLLHCIKAAPVASFIILALVWIPTGILPACICALMVLPIVWSNVEQGIRQIDRRLLEMAQVFRVGRLKTLLRVKIPAVMPYLLTALTTGLGFAWKSGIAAEVICQPKPAIGKQLYLAKIYLETPEVFAWTAVVILLSILLELCLKKWLLFAEKRIGMTPKATPEKERTA